MKFCKKPFQWYFYFFCSSSEKKVIQEIKNITFSHHPNTPSLGKNVSFATKNQFYSQSMEIKVVSVNKLKTLRYSKKIYDDRLSQKSKYEIDFLFKIYLKRIVGTP